MLAQTLVPFKFLFAMTEIVTASLMLATESVFPTENSTTSDSFIAGCALIIVLAFAQILITFIGVNIFNTRVHFQNVIFNGFGSILLIWFIMARWPKEYVWYIWGIICLYPFFNQIMSLISVCCHSSKLTYEKFRSNR